MDDMTRKDLKFSASIFFIIGFHTVLWKLIELYLSWAKVSNAEGRPLYAWSFFLV